MKYDGRKTPDRNLLALQLFLNAESMKLEDRFVKGEFTHDSEVGVLFKIISDASLVLRKYSAANNARYIK